MKLLGRAGDEVTEYEIEFELSSPRKVRLTRADGGVVEGEGSDLFEALAAVRRQIESQGVVLECNGSRVDVFPSQMQRQAGDGRRAYHMTYPRNGQQLESVDIFEPASRDSEFATVDQQRAWFREWVRSPLVQ